MQVAGEIVADPQVVASELEGGAALLDLRTSSYFGLNAVGSYVWTQIQSPKTLDQICASVSEAFDVSEERCRPDVAALIQQFRDAKLVLVNG